jgi:hypothetical protein
VSGATRTLRGLGPSPYLGVLLTPRAANSVEAITGLGLPWAADNSAYSCWDEGRFHRMLDRIAGVPGCLWVAAPDVVANAAATLALFDLWQPRMAACGLPVALVLQDGQERFPVPWDRLDAVFVGGGTAWKLGDAARGLCVEAKARGKLIHVGRVNSKRRLAHLARWGCVDSVDGSSFSRWPDTRIPAALRWISEAEARTGEA